MPLLPFTQTLYELAVDDAVNTAVDSLGLSVRANYSDAELNASNTFSVIFNMTAVGGSAPTLDAKLEGSVDGTNWFDTGVAMTQMTSATTQVEKKTVPEMFPYMRVAVNPAGTAAPTWHGDVKFVSTAPFTLKA